MGKSHAGHEYSNRSASSYQKNQVKEIEECLEAVLEAGIINDRLVQRPGSDT